MSRRFAVVHEAEADFHTATKLADRAFIEAIDWLDKDLIADQRAWLAEGPGGHRLKWSTIPRLARDARIRAHGHFGGEPGEPDAAAARRAILYLLETIPDLGAVVLIRDQDGEPERRDGLEQARRHDQSGTVVIIGLAIVERESWVLCGFEPEDEEEKARLDLERRSLGFDPRHRSQELTVHKSDHALRSAKRVLRALCGNDWERERRCWANTHLDLLRERGDRNGLADYLREVRDRLAPLIGHVTAE